MTLVVYLLAALIAIGATSTARASKVSTIGPGAPTTYDVIMPSGG